MEKEYNKPKYEVGDKVKTAYGIGKVVAIRDLILADSITYCYKIKYSFFKRLWCFEFTIEGKFVDEN